MSENQEFISAKDAQQPVDSPTSNSSESQICQAVDRRAFLQLPVAQRNALLAQQVATVAEYFLPGADSMEWTDEYIDDDIWHN
jgi:hypothetical protein